MCTKNLQCQYLDPVFIETIFLNTFTPSSPFIHRAHTHIVYPFIYRVMYLFSLQPQSITQCNGADKTRGVRIHVQAFNNRHGQNTGRVEQMANRYIEGKADEYSSKRTWSSICEQYPEGLTRGVLQYTRQKVRNQTTRQHGNTRLTKIRNEN